MPTKYNYSKVIYNKFLGLSKEIKAETSEDLAVKIEDQRAKWRDQEKRRREKQRNENLKYQAEYDTKTALFEIDKYKNILFEALKSEYSIDINYLKKTDEFKEFEFKEEAPNIEEINTELGVPQKKFLLEFFLKSMQNKRIKLENNALNLLDIRMNE